jgi:dolichyl-phosphate-mannose-protein mannosyltransferase
VRAHLSSLNISRRGRTPASALWNGAHALVSLHAWLTLARLQVALMSLRAALQLSIGAHFLMVGIARRATAPLGRTPLPNVIARHGRWLKAHVTDELLVACLAVALSVCAYAWYAHAGLTVGYGDAVSRMMIARRVVAGRATGLAQLGTTWLPLHTMLMLPLIWNDTLFHSGFAGAFPSMVTYALTAIYLYRMARLLFSSRGTAWVAALIFLLNPSVLYMQSTAMSEVPLLCGATIAIYYMVRWARSYYTMDLAKSAVAVAVSAGIRYDGWALAAAFAVVVLYVAWRRQGYAGAESHSILYGMLAFSSCAAWVIYNGVIFHDPLLFLFFGDSTHTVHHLEGYHKPWLSFEMFGYAAGETAGWMMMALAALGLILFAVRHRLQASALPVYALLLPIAYHWLIFYVGIDSIRLPQLGATIYWNARFGLMLVPAVVIFAAYLASQHHYLRLTTLLATLAFVVINNTLQMPMALREPASPQSASVVPHQRMAAEWLLAHYHGGDVLISYDPDAPMAYFLMRGLPDEALLTDAAKAPFAAALAHPETSVKWIVYDDYGQATDLIWIALHNRRDWRRHFVLRQSFGPTHIYEYVGSPDAGKAQQSAAPSTSAIGRASYSINRLPSTGAMTVRAATLAGTAIGMSDSAHIRRASASIEAKANLAAHYGRCECEA